MEKRFENFAEFWPFYLGQHTLASTRQWHFLGTSMAMTCIGLFILLGYKILILLALVAGYAPAWYAHFYIEKNRPATFTYPIWSFLADLKMFGLMLQGELDAELEKFNISRHVE